MTADERSEGAQAPTNSAVGETGQAKNEGSLAWRAFGLTWISYASYYLTRKPFSVAKRSIEGQLGIDRIHLSYIDTAHNAAYAVGQFGFGLLADNVGARRVLGAGMLATAVCSLLFGASSTFTFFVIFLGLNGLAQSTGWSANLKVMAAWIPKERRGRVMGLWSTCYQIGSLVANPIAGVLVTASAIGWRLAFYVPSFWVAAVGIALLIWLPEKHAPVVVLEKATVSAAVKAEQARVLRTPLIWALGMSYFFMKFIRYSLFAWLPYFMEQTLHHGTAASAAMSAAFEAGGFIGAITVGTFSDRFFGGKRLGISLVCLVGLAASMPLYSWAATRGSVQNVLALALVGFCLFGPDTILSATAAQDIGGPAAAATAGGVINGIGSIGQIASSYVAAWISKEYGWDRLYSLLGAGALVSALVIAPFAVREARRRPAENPV